MDYLTKAHYLTPNVPAEHGYDDAIMDKAWDTVRNMWWRLNDVGMYEIGMVGRCKEVYVFMITRPVDEYTVKVFHLSPLTRDDAEELDLHPEPWYDYPDFIPHPDDDDEYEESW